MYSGPGSGPMTAAATAWDGLAADLNSTATSFQSVLSGLSGAWQGPSSATMTSAAEPYLSWISTTAAQAQQAGAQAKAAAGAFDTAYAATVPPPLIAANRASLTSLTATNFFGQNSPAIAALEAQYNEMWAQDVAMMNSYASAAQQAASLQSFTAAPQVANAMANVTQAATNPAGSSNVLSTLQQLIPNLLSQFVTPTSTLDPTGGLSGIVTSLENSLGLGSLPSPTGILGSTGTEGVLLPLQVAYYMGMMASTPARMFMGLGQSAGSAGSAGLANSESLMTSIGQFVDSKMQLVVGGVTNQLKSWGSAVSAQLAHASSIGRLSVPQAWSVAAPPPAAAMMTRAAPVLPATTVSATAPSAGMPGGPFTQALMGALSGRGLGSLAAKAPKVIPRSPAGG